jgi:hypothetical protein
MVNFYKIQQDNDALRSEDRRKIEDQVHKAGFSGDIKIYVLGFDFEDSISLVVEGVYEGEECCVAVGYGMNRQKLAIRNKWYRHAPPSK